MNVGPSRSLYFNHFCQPFVAEFCIFSIANPAFLSCHDDFVKTLKRLGSDRRWYFGLCKSWGGMHKIANRFVVKWSGSSPTNTFQYTYTLHDVPVSRSVHFLRLVHQLPPYPQYVVLRPPWLRFWFSSRTLFSLHKSASHDKLCTVIHHPNDHP